MNPCNGNQPPSFATRCSATAPATEKTSSDGLQQMEYHYYKTRWCKTSEHKQCPYESRCMFAHTREELRTEEQNIADGLVTAEAIRQYQRRLRAEHKRAKRKLKREEEKLKSEAKEEDVENSDHHQAEALPSKAISVPRLEGFLSSTLSVASEAGISEEDNFSPKNMSPRTLFATPPSGVRSPNELKKLSISFFNSRPRAELQQPATVPPTRMRAVFAHNPYCTDTPYLVEII